jgi:hypothetical protein
MLPAVVRDHLGGCDGAGWAIAELQTASVSPNNISGADFIVAPARSVKVLSQPD